MFNLISRNLVRPVVLACIVFAGANAALAQTPQSTPRPTPAPGDPTQTTGSDDPIPGTTSPTKIRLRLRERSKQVRLRRRQELSDSSAGSNTSPQQPRRNRAQVDDCPVNPGAVARTRDSAVSGEAAAAGSESTSFGCWQ